MLLRLALSSWAQANSFLRLLNSWSYRHVPLCQAQFILLIGINSSVPGLFYLFKIIRFFKNVLIDYKNNSVFKMENVKE
jgi:hypothetical protein